jgi:hypothetical protein
MVVAVLALYGIGKEVWVARVVENAPESVSLLPQFYFAAFLHTHVAVQILSLAVIVSVIYLARETAKLITSSLIFVRA